MGGLPLYLKTYCAHQLDAVAAGDDTLAQSEIEFHSAVLELILEVNVAERAGFETPDVGEREIVRADEADGMTLHERAHDSFGTDAPVL